jgi:hypothetical protein
MKHDSTKAMAFYFLQRINYNDTWEKIEYGMGYDFGDFCFKNPETVEKIKRIARQIHIEFHNHFDKEGNSQ